MAATLVPLLDGGRARVRRVMDLGPGNTATTEAAVVVVDVVGVDVVVVVVGSDALCFPTEEE